MRILFAVDIHGNERSFHRIFEQAESLPVDAVVLGGDLLPSPRSLGSFCADQRSFINGVIRPQCEAFRRTSRARIFVMLGNDDSSVCAHRRAEHGIRRAPALYTYATAVPWESM